MPAITPQTAALRGCYVISLRPAGAHAGLRRAAAVRGAQVLALSPWRLVPRGDASARQALRQALAAPLAIFTSPAAVRAAAALASLAPGPEQVRIAVGATTASALRRAGVPAPLHPARMDSEGLLALPVLGTVTGTGIGLITAPEGRSHLGASLRARGARILRADVYDRVPCAPSPQVLARLRDLPADTPLLLALSSGLALEACLASLPDDLVARLKQARVSAASARLAELAHAHGFADVVPASDARPASLLAAAMPSPR